MKYTDIAIIGGGLAGSTAAAMLGRAGIASVLIDPHETYPFDFRVERSAARNSSADSSRRHGRRSRCCARPRMTTRTGSRDSATCSTASRPASTASCTNSPVEAVRAEIKAPAEIVYAKAVDVATGSERQKLTLSSGETLSARLVVLASGLSVALRRNLGIERKVLSAAHSISVGFDIVPLGRPAFEFPALTYFSDRPAGASPT